CGMVCVPNFGLFMVWIIGSWGWLSNKCILYDKPISHWVTPQGYCSNGNLCADCWDVCDLKLNLSIIPSHYQFLWLNVRSGSVLQSGTLSRMKKLFCSKFITSNSSLRSNIFSDLTNLEELDIDNYRLSLMALDALAGIPLLKKLCLQQIVNMSQSLTNLYFK
uniref:Uncharacterized protein n=1 Tax=Hucho hucho TaxID=62062 RepID=A0A4W5PV09_9TELE